MAEPTCQNCGKHQFEFSTISPAGGVYKMGLIICSSCGVPAGVTDAINGPALMQDVQMKLMNGLEAAMHAILARLERLESKLSDPPES